MKERNRVFLLVFIMTFIALLVAGVTTYVLYRAALDEEAAQLIETAQSQARLIEAVARFNAVYNIDYSEGAEKATLNQIIDAHANYRGFGDTGEFTLARREGGEIIFLLSHRHYDLDYPKPVPFDSKLAEPIRRALSDLSGTVIGLDYRGEKVLAAYEPVGELSLGIVAKIDMAEIKAPFIRAGLVAFGSAVIAILLGALLFFRVTNPMIRKLAASEEKLSSFMESATEGFALYDSELNLIEVNKEALKIFPAGTTKEDVIGKNILEISPGLEKTGRYDRYCEVMKTGKPLYFDDLVLAPKFGSRHLFVRAFRAAEGLGLIFTDITEKKKAEEALKKSQKDLRNLAAHLQSVREDERKSVAREIHDDVGQNLAALKMDMYMIEKKLRSDQKPLIDRMIIMMELIDKSIKTVRRIHEELRPSLLDGLGLVEAIELYMKECEDKTGARCELHIEPESIDLSEKRSLALFRILQESMTNVRLHSGATKVSASIREKNGKLELEIKDNGVGIAEQHLTKSESYGLMGIRERVQFLRGELQVKGIPGKGTTVTIRIPLKTVNQDQS